MKKLAVLAVFSPSAALAHDGFHVHPHGVDSFWMVAALVAVGASAAAIAWVRK